MCRLNTNYFPWLTLCFVIGIWIGVNLKIVLLPLGLLLLLLALGAFIAEGPQLKEIIFLAVFFVLGILWGRVEIVFNSPVSNLPQEHTIRLYVLNVPKCYSYGSNFIAKITSGKLKDEKIYVKLQGVNQQSNTLRRGDVLEVRGDISCLEGPRNPGEFNYKKYYAIRGVHYQLSTHADKVKILGYKKPNLLLLITDHLREEVEIAISKVGKGQATAVFSATLLGDTAPISEENLLKFKQLGIMHLFAISGLQVGIIVIILLFFTKKFKLSPVKEFVIAGLVLLVYAGIAQFSISVMRAVIIVLFFLFSKIISKETAPVIALSFAAFILLMYNPRLIEDLGFLLTFGCVLGLIFFLEVFSRSYQEKPLEILFLAVAAQLPILPIIISNFHVFGLLQLLMAVPTAVLAFPIVFMGFLTIIFAPISSLLAQASAVGGVLAAKLLLLLSDGLSIVDGGVKYFAAPAHWQVTVYYLFIIGVYVYYFKEYISPKKTAICLILAPLILLLPYKGEGLRVTFIDVGQGDAILMELPNGENILCDGGGSTLPKGNSNTVYDVGAEVVMPVLQAKGINKLQYIIATHPHSDHIGGLSAILKNFSVEKLLVTSIENEESLQLKKYAESKAVKVISLSRGSKLKFKDVEIEFIAPVKNYHNTSSDENNSSLVLLVKHAKATLLLTGDIEAQAIRDITDKYNLQQTTFIKVPHHGSKYSLQASALNHMAPALAIISVGKNNYFGHPSREVVEYWENRQIPVLRTDKDGAVEIYMGREEVAVTTYLSAKRFRIQ